MMNDRTGGGGNRRRAGALTAMAAVALLTAACGVHVSLGGRASSATSASTGAPTYAQEVALAQCMRSHGVPDFPDPDAAGGYSLSGNGTLEGAGGSVNMNSSQAQAAYGDCRHLLPGGPSIAQLEQRVQQAQQAEEKQLPLLLKFAQCMRGHGEPDYPDPTLSGQGTSGSPEGAGINPGSPQFQAAVAACQHVLPAGAHISVGTTSGTRQS